MILPLHTLAILLGIWLAVVLCAFMCGWEAGRRWHHGPDPRDIDRAVRRHPSTRFEPDHLPRPGRLLAEVETVQPDPAAWWPALERTAAPVTQTFSHVEVSNWEANKRRDMDAWLAQHGLPRELR